MDPLDADAAEEPLLRVMSLHALTYCERLFYLEEVEGLQAPNQAIFDGRRAHEEMDEGELALDFVDAAPGRDQHAVAGERPDRGDARHT